MKIFIYDENRVLMRTVGTPDIMQGENNATLIFMSVAGIDETNFQDYLAQFAATIGTSHPADIITDFGTYVIDGVEYKGWKYFVSSKFTQVTGALNANLILSSGGSTLISQTVTLNVNPSASGVTWFKNITQAQWEQLLAYCIGLRNPNLGVVDTSADPNILDDYNSEAQLGAYLFVEAQNGNLCLLTVGYDDNDEAILQNVLSVHGSALYISTRMYEDGEWTDWTNASGAGAISVRSNLFHKIPTASDDVEAALVSIDKLLPNNFIMAQGFFVNLAGDNLKDVGYTFTDLGNDSYMVNFPTGKDISDFMERMCGVRRIPAPELANSQVIILTTGGSAYALYKSGNNYIVQLVTVYALKSSLDAVNQTLSDGIATNNNLIKHSVVGNSAMTMDADTYVITITNYSLTGEVLSTYKVDIPAEMAFVSGRYDAEDRDLIFTLQNGNEVAVPVDDIFVGLATQDWVNTAIADALLPYATTSWVDANYMSLTKGGYVNLAEAPSSPNVYYFGAKNGTSSFLRLSDNSFDVKTTRGDVVMQFSLNFSNSNLARFVKIDGSTTPSTLSVTDVPFKQGTHSLVLDDDLDEANAKITALESKTAKQESDIQYLYRQVIGGGDLVTETDSGVSLTSQNFPLTVSPKALLDYVGGMCQKVNQLVNFDNDVASTSWGGAGTYSITNKKISVVVNASQSIISAGVLNLGIHVKNGHKYYVYSSMQAGVGFFLYDNVTAQMFAFNAITSLNQEITNTLRLNYYKESLAEQTTYTFNLAFVDITDLWPTDTPTSTSDARIQWLMSYLSSHPEYDAGSILTAPVTKVVSKGFNLWDEEWEVGGLSQGQEVPYASGIRSVGYTPILPNAEYYIKLPVITNLAMAVNFYDENHNFISNVNKTASGTFTAPANARYLRINLNNAYGTTYNHDICINVSNATMNGTYMPYRAPIEYPVPAEVRALEGYGWGFNADCCNEVSLEGKSYGKMVARVDLGTLEWNKHTDAGHEKFFTNSLKTIIKNAASASAKANITCAKYTASTANAIYSHSSDDIIAVETNGQVSVYDTTYMDGSAETFQAAMSGVYLYYELATPVETDISEYIDSDVIVVSAGGHLEFENENDMGVPYSATYQCEPETQEGE